MGTLLLCVCVCVCVCVRERERNKQDMWQQWLCVLSVLLCYCVLSCCAKPLRGDNGRRGAEWGDKFRMRGSDEAFCRPPVSPQSCTASDGCIYCRPTSTSSLITRIDKLALPHLLTTHKKRQKKPQWQAVGWHKCPLPPSCLFFLLSVSHLKSPLNVSFKVWIQCEPLFPFVDVFFIFYY